MASVVSELRDRYHPRRVGWALGLHDKNQDDRGKGSTFWLMLKKLVGSYLLLSSTSRW